MEKVFVSICNMSINASYLIMAVIFIRFVFKCAPKYMRCFLWLLVGIRLIIPFSVESALSLVPDGGYVDTKPLNGNDTVFSDIWVMGMMVMLVYLAGSYLYLKYRLRMSVPEVVSDEKGKSTKIYRNNCMGTSFLLGIVRPRIYVPYSVTDDELPFIIMHEKAHLKRCDHLIKPFSFVILCVHWFNPVIWIAYIMLAGDIELACDEKVVMKLGCEHKKEYSRVLLSCSASRHMISVCPVAFGEFGVKERVKNVLNYKKPTFWIITIVAVICIIVPVCFMTKPKENVPVKEQDTKETEKEMTMLQDSDEKVEQQLSELNEAEVKVEQQLSELNELEVKNQEAAAIKKALEKQLEQQLKEQKEIEKQIAKEKEIEKQILEKLKNEGYSEGWVKNSDDEWVHISMVKSLPE